MTMTCLSNGRRRRLAGLAAMLALPLCGCQSDSTRTPDPAVEPSVPLEELAVSDTAVSDTAVRDAAVEEPTAQSADDAFRELLGQMGVRYLPETKSLEVSGVVNMQEGLIEVFACAPGGKAHESIVVLDCIPSGLHAGLIALGLEAGTPVEVGTDATYRAPTGPGVVVEVRWRSVDGAERVTRAEGWIRDRSTESPMDPVEWLFTGSFMQSVTGDPGDATYAADYVKSLVTTYHDASTILENPLVSGSDDTIYYANAETIPPVGTPVTAIFRVP